MLRYLGNRLLYAIPTVACVVFAVFLLLHLIPGDPAQVMLGVGASEQDLAALREKLGLDRPLVVQFARAAVEQARRDRPELYYRFVARVAQMVSERLRFAAERQADVVLAESQS